MLSKFLNIDNFHILCYNIVNNNTIGDDIMKRLIIRDKLTDVFGMANLNPQKSGLHVVIWSEQCGITRNKPDNIPRVKIFTLDNQAVSVSIERPPKILAKSKHLKKSDEKYITEGIDYVGRNYDLFLKHYMNTDFSFDDEDLINALRQRGEYR